MKRLLKYKIGYIIILLCFSFVFTIYMPAFADNQETGVFSHYGNEIFDFEMSNIDWELTKKEFLDLFNDRIDYTEYIYNNNTSALCFKAKLFSVEIECMLHFNDNEKIEELTVYYDDELYSPMKIYSMLVNKFGCPDKYDDSFEEDTGYSYYLFHYAKWLNDPTGIFMYTNDIELYYYLNEKGIEFDLISNFPQVHIYPLKRMNEIINIFNE